MRFINMLLKMKCVLIINCISLMPRLCRRGFASCLIEKYRYKTDRMYSKLRTYLYVVRGARFGQCVYIGPGVYVDCPENVCIGNNVSIQHNCILSAYGKIVIGNDVSIAHGTSIITTAHPVKKGKIFRNKALEVGGVQVGSNVWIGAKVTILKDVSIADNSVVGAHALVNKSLGENNCVYAGVPCRKVKELD